LQGALSLDLLCQPATQDDKAAATRRSEGFRSILTFGATHAATAPASRPSPSSDRLTTPRSLLALSAGEYSERWLCHKFAGNN